MLVHQAKNVDDPHEVREQADEQEESLVLHHQRATAESDNRLATNAPSPNLVMSLSRSTILYEKSGWTSARTRWMELVPISRMPSLAMKP